jgi:hypothetical protein
MKTAMDENSKAGPAGKPEPETDLRQMIRRVIQEFVQTEQQRAEPAYKAELIDERRRREQLERRMSELEQEATASKKMAEESDRAEKIRSELQRLGVQKVDLAFRAVRDDVQRSDDGRLVAKSSDGDLPLHEYLSRFVNENPELLPARIAGGSGTAAGKRPVVATGGVDLDKIKPGMSAEDRDRVRQEIANVAAQVLRGN